MPDSVTVRIEFGAACPNHGAPEFAKLARALPSLFPDSRVAVMPYQMTEYFNHFRVHVDCYLIFDSYTRYPPVMEVAKCVWTFLHNAKPNEIPHSRGIPFSYWRCPEHDGKLQPRQEGACAARHSFIRSAESGKLVGFSVGRSSSSKTNFFSCSSLRLSATSSALSTMNCTGSAGRSKTMAAVSFCDEVKKSCHNQIFVTV